MLNDCFWHDQPIPSFSLFNYNWENLLNCELKKAPDNFLCLGIWLKRLGITRTLALNANTLITLIQGIDSGIKRLRFFDLRD